MLRRETWSHMIQIYKTDSKKTIIELIFENKLRTGSSQSQKQLEQQ
jgi:hypothetical protein